MPLDNLDTYFHLRFGHEFLSGDWSLRHPGSVSSLATADWVPTQWLSEVVMAQTEDWFGLAGVAWLSGLLFLSLALVVYWACRRQAEPAVAALLVVLTMIACTSGISMRPQLVSYVLVVATIAAWQRAADAGRAPWLLVPVTWVWTMCHGMWPVGIVIGVVAVLGLALDRGHPRRTLARMAAVPVLSAAVSLLTPVGPGLFPAVLRVGSRAKYFYEWDPPDYTKPWVAMLAVSWRWPWCRGCGAPSGCRGSTCCCSGSRRCARSTRCAPCRWRPAWPPRSPRPPLQPVLGARPSVLRRERLLVVGGALLALATLAVLVPHTADEPARHPVVARRRARRPARGHQGHRRQRLRRLPDVAVPPAGRRRARLRRPLHRRRARAERGHRGGSGAAGSSWCRTPARRTPCSRRARRSPTTCARSRGGASLAAQRRPGAAAAAAGLAGPVTPQNSRGRTDA